MVLDIILRAGSQAPSAHVAAMGVYGDKIKVSLAIAKEHKYAKIFHKLMSVS